MTTRYGSVLSLPKGAHKVPEKMAPVLGSCPAAEEGPVLGSPIDRTHRPPVGAQRFSRSKALADGLRAALKAREDSYEDLPSDVNGNVW